MDMATRISYLNRTPNDLGSCIRATAVRCRWCAEEGREERHYNSGDHDGRSDVLRMPSKAERDLICKPYPICEQYEDGGKGLRTPSNACGTVIIKVKRTWG